jgi:hypothetical protein
VWAVAEGEVQVNQAHLSPTAVGESRGEVGRQGRLAAAAFRREDRHELAARAGLVTAAEATDGLTQLPGQLSRSAHGRVQTGEVALLHHLEDAGP